MVKRAVRRIAAFKLLAKVFQVHRRHVGNFLATCRSIKKMVIVSEADFGEGFHYGPNEPVSNDLAYRVWPKDQPLPINDKGECVV